MTAEWDAFIEALATCLADLPSRATLIITASGNRYVQFQQFDIKLSAELTGNYYLAQPISDSAAQRLRDLGWTAPALHREIENWRRTLTWPLPPDALPDLARSAALGLHEALGIDTPGELSAKGWTDHRRPLSLGALSTVTHRDPARHTLN
ncbi:TY-Chap domain-containing protein [Nocardia huaxiensis]|uniref:TY-Chap N-terminal domain-containing protein n=1 Tax=Nocardia huaxiensis TaxID=2755382 RepID=A0A7D6ZKL1_9NOCA|nr:hypothetical protein [Nocardia huaxiensis]QLY33459.1 hypothetical protein H0264_15580 [Nocardia huaxiensis]UFS99630.1 hypothetical protein LPY97_17975 [Nocardia huaxiensis]